MRTHNWFADRGWWPFGRRRHSEYVALIPELTAQLEDISAQIEGAVVDVSGGFAGIVERANTAVATVRNMAETENGAADGNESLILASRATLQQLLDYCVSHAKHSMEAVYRMEEVVSSMKEIGNTTKAVDKIAFGIKILALNAKIEAVHVGDRGAGFAVVADEISKHAAEATSVADSIRSRVSSLDANIAGTMENLKSLASTDMNSLIREKDRAENVISLLKVRNDAMRNELQAAAGLSESLAADVTRAIVAMQFQDRVNQRMAHVVETLNDIHAELQGVNDMDADDADDRSDSAVARMRSRYTMAEEHAPVLAPTGTDGPDASIGAVELF